MNKLTIIFKHNHTSYAMETEVDENEGSEALILTAQALASGIALEQEVLGNFERTGISAAADTRAEGRTDDPDPDDMS